MSVVPVSSPVSSAEVDFPLPPMVRERATRRALHDVRILTPPSSDSMLNLEAVFGRRAPLEVDIGCGRGRFLLARAAAHPEFDFLGIDRVILRLRKLDMRAGDAGLTNIRLIQGDALQIARAQLPAATVSACYVFFPDPWPKRRHHSRRLVSAAFIDLVDHVLSPTGCIHIATDHGDYFQAIQRAWDADTRFASVEPYVPTETEETDFGMLFRAEGRVIGRCSYQRRKLSSGS